MAVKQNNTEANGGSSKVNGSTTGGSSNGKPSNGAGNNINMDGGGVNVEQPVCSGAQQTMTNSNNGNEPMVDNENGESTPSESSEKEYKLESILRLINILNIHHHTVIPEQDILILSGRIIHELAKVEVPRGSPEQMIAFKGDILKVGKFFSKTQFNDVLMYLLNTVCQLISDPGTATPSCAIAIIFDLFEVNMIVEAVRVLLHQNVSDQNIRCTVGVLSEWLRICNFSRNLNLWIMAILSGLLQQGKLMLFDQVSLDNIDIMLTSSIIPVLRPKVTPILFIMLTHIYDTPKVFHKIVAKFPRIFPFLKQQAAKATDSADDIKDVVQKLVDITSALMLRFYDYGDLYEPVELLLKDYQPSDDYMKYINSYKINEDGANGALEENNRNTRVGLVNLGNTCYMNSILQALAMTKGFCREILLTNCKSALIVNMQQQIALMLYSIRCVLTPSRVLDATRPPGFSIGIQQDSSEFLGYLLEILHESELAYYKKISMLPLRSDLIAYGSRSDDESFDDAGRSVGGASDSIPTECRDENVAENVDMSCSSTDHKRTEESGESITTQSTIEKIFTGKLATTYKCLTCGCKSHNADTFRDLQLSFPEIEIECGSNYSVQDLIDYYCSPEKLCGDNQYYCGKCQKLTDAQRYISVISAPPYLILTLKHFKYDQKFQLRAKLMHKVFHDEKVSVKVCAPNTFDEVGSVHYELYAGVVHSGYSMDSGHYFTYASDVSKSWFKFNDNIVTTTTLEELDNLSPPNTPYILFYRMSGRSNETCESQASTGFVEIEVPTTPALDELPSELQTYVALDNYAFVKEQNALRFKHSAPGTSYNAQQNYNNDDDDEDMPPAGGCGGNAMNVNVNRFVC